jgi:hypothetical protein
MARALCVLILVAVASASATASAVASQTTTLGVKFAPYRLGHGTSVSFSTQIKTPGGQTPSPLSEFVMHYPSTLGFAVSGLGTSTCAEPTLEALGPTGCPTGSVMGRGNIVVAVPIETPGIEENASVVIVRAPQEGGVAMFFYAEGLEPVYADVILTGLLSQDATSSSEAIRVSAPLVQGLPGGPDVAVVRLDATLGPLGLTYYERVRGEFVPYRPRGILLPRRCPRGGFRFSADFTFLDGSRSTALDRIACPAPTGRGSGV